MSITILIIVAAIAVAKVFYDVGYEEGWDRGRINESNRHQKTLRDKDLEIEALKATIARLQCRNEVFEDNFNFE